jgi:hypothetical protein
MESSNYSLGDIAALLGNRSGFGNGDGLGWLILIFLFFGAMGGGWNRNPGPAVPPNVATVTDVQSMINNQTVNTGLNNIALATADNNYQTAQLINGQTNILQQQNYANQINAVQGFNSVNQTLQGGFDGVSQQLQNQTNQLAMQISQLGYQMDQCCCSIKTQMLQDRLEDRNRELGVAQNAINNAQQTQNILGALGRFVAWTPSGSQAASSTVTTG